MYSAIDSLPLSYTWHCDVITITGDEMEGGDDGSADPKPMMQTVELWRRDAMEVIRELLGNADFDGSMVYAPERVFADEGGKERIYDEMWTADWWWETQVRGFGDVAACSPHADRTTGKTPIGCDSGTRYRGFRLDATFIPGWQQEGVASLPDVGQHLQGDPQKTLESRNSITRIHSNRSSRLLQEKVSRGGGSTTLPFMYEQTTRPAQGDWKAWRRCLLRRWAGTQSLPNPRGIHR